MPIPITIEDLNDIQCYEFSIQTSSTNKDFLILICNDKEKSRKLNEILHQHAFDLKIFIDDSTGNYSLQFEFIESEIVFKLDTGKNELSYPPLKKLKESQIKFITTGVWNGHSTDGRICEYLPEMMRLGELDMGQSFTQAKEVQFVSSRKEEEPAVIVLIYEDYNHIFQAESDEAYNKLAAMTISKPILEIAPSGNRVNLKIWDILLDLEVNIEGLAFKDEELKQFLQKTDPNKSFAFVLGFRHQDESRAAIASTKKEGFEIITLKGYTHKKQEEPPRILE